MRILLSSLFLPLFILCLWASFEIPLWEEWASLKTSPWFLVTLADLYIGFILFGLLTYWFKKKWIYSVLWTLAFFSLGNMATIIWIWLHRKEIHEKLG